MAVRSALGAERRRLIAQTLVETVLLACMGGIVAMVTVHWEHGLFASDNGIEVPLLYLTAAVAFALIGYGRYSIDSFLGLSALWTPMLAWIALGAGAFGAVANLGLRRRPSPPASA